MTDVRPSLAAAIPAITRRWGWFVALGVGELVLGVIAFANRMAANLASVLIIGAAMIAASTIQTAHAPAAGWRWIVAAGRLTVGVGRVVLAAWLAIGLWLLGAMPVVDLVYQGGGLLAFGLALCTRALRRAYEPATE